MTDGDRGTHHPLFARVQARAAATEERKGGAVYRRRLLHGLTGRVVEIGAGSGVNFTYYPAGVTEVLAIEPEANLRAQAEAAAARAPVPVRVVTGSAEHLPVPDASVDAAVTAGVLCSLPDPRRGLAELRRVLRPGGQLRFYEHVVAQPVWAARLQRLADATVWPRLFAGCHTSRDTRTTIAAAGFAIHQLDRFTFHPTLLAVPVSPRILGTAHRLDA